MRKIETAEVTTKKLGHYPTFPVLGLNGYAGEQDGDTVRYFTIVGTKKNIITKMVPDLAVVQHAEYSRHFASWEIIYGVWESQLKKGELEETKKVAVLRFVS